MNKYLVSSEIGPEYDAYTVAVKWNPAVTFNREPGVVWENIYPGPGIDVEYLVLVEAASTGLAQTLGSDLIHKHRLGVKELEKPKDNPLEELINLLLFKEELQGATSGKFNEFSIYYGGLKQLKNKIAGT